MSFMRRILGGNLDMRVGLAPCIAFAFAAFLAAAPISLAQEADWSKVVAAAKSEGRLVFYNGGTIGVPRAVTKLFEKKYGIQVDVVEGLPSEIRERMRSERASGRAIGDFHLAGAPTAAAEQIAGSYQPHGPLPLAVKLREPFRDNGVVIPVSLSRFSVLINTNLVKADDVPKSWMEFLEPKWRGKILISDPRIGGPAQGTFAVLYDVFGREYLEKLALQNLVIEKDWRLAERRTANGEYSVNFPFNLPDLNDLQGLPVQPIVPREGTPYNPTYVMMLKNAPHPNAARLFMNFWLDDEAQTVVSEYGQESTTGAPRSDKIPPAAIPVYQAKLMGTVDPDPAHIDKMVAMFKEILGVR